LTRTTRGPERDVTALLEGIDKYAVTATRLHPRPGTPDPRASHIGGPLLWPGDEPWPTCDAEHVLAAETPIPPALLARIRAADPAKGWPGYAEAIAELANQTPGFVGINRATGSALGYTVQPQRAPSPLVAVAQLRVTDIRDLCPPGDADILQVLWCPNDHDIGAESYAPAVALRWRREANLAVVPDRPPSPTVVGETAYLPRPCVLHPEQVVEYPWWQDLPAELGQQVRAWDLEHDGLYHRQLSTAPGWKVGGWPPWPTTDPVPMYCISCAAPMRQLLQIDSGEWGDPQRWRPLEEDHVDAATAEYADAAEPTGVVVGRTGLYRIFHCPRCPDAPIRVDLQ